MAAEQWEKYLQLAKPIKQSDIDSKVNTLHQSRQSFAIDSSRHIYLRLKIYKTLS